MPKIASERRSRPKSITDKICGRVLLESRSDRGHGVKVKGDKHSFDYDYIKFAMHQDGEWKYAIQWSGSSEISLARESELYNKGRDQSAIERFWSNLEPNSKMTSYDPRARVYPSLAYIQDALQMQACQHQRFFRKAAETLLDKCPEYVVLKNGEDFRPRIPLAPSGRIRPPYSFTALPQVTMQAVVEQDAEIRRGNIPEALRIGEDYESEVV